MRQIFLPSYSAAGSRFINAESTKHTTGVHREHLTLAFIFANGKCELRIANGKWSNSLFILAPFSIFNFQLLNFLTVAM